MPYTIQTADTADLSALTELYLTYCAELRQCGLQYEINVAEVPSVLSTRIKSKLFYIGIVRHEGKDKGFVICSISKLGREYLCEGNEQIGHIHDIYVTSSMRRTGCANALLDVSKAWLKECGVNCLQLEVLSGNADGKFFWERRGGHKIATLYQIKF